MGNGQDTGSFLVRMINLVINNLMRNPKRALIILFASFAGILIIGEVVTKTRDIDPAKPAPKQPAVYQDASTYFNLNEIKDDEYTPSVTQTVIIRSNIPLAEVPTKTPQPTEKPVFTATPSCTTELEKNGLAPGNNAKVTYLGGYYTEVPVRANYRDSNQSVGTVKSGDQVYLLDGPVCYGNQRWWKINVAKYKFIGWIYESVNKMPLLEPVK